MATKESLTEHYANENHPVKRTRKARIFGKNANYVKLASGEIVDDEFLNKFCAINQKEFTIYTKKFATSGKVEQIKHWVSRIEKIKDVIKQVCEDSTLTPEVKCNKVQHCLEIIQSDKTSIKKTIEYLKFRSDKDALLFAEMNRIK